MFKALIAVFVLLMTSGCGAVALHSPVLGFWYTDVHSGMTATSNQTGNRVGESCATSILGLVATGDASIEAARRNGGITMVSTVDQSDNSILGIYAKHCAVVRGR